MFLPIYYIYNRLIELVNIFDIFYHTLCNGVNHLGIAVSRIKTEREMDSQQSEKETQKGKMNNAKVQKCKMKM